MQANLSWPQARALADNGSVVRRAGWLSSSIFATAGGLYWFNAPDGSQRVITAVDFQRGEFLALDWTDSAANQGHCVGIDLTAEMVATPATLIASAVSTVKLTISLVLDADLVFYLTSSSSSLTVPSSVTILAGQTSVSFSATAGTLTASSSESITATSNQCACSVAIALQFVDVPPPPAPPHKSIIFTGTATGTPAVGWVWVQTYFGPNRYPDGDPATGYWVWSGPIPSRYPPHPRGTWEGAKPTQAIGRMYFQNPWSSPCSVNISGTIYKQLYGGAVNDLVHKVNEGAFKILSSSLTPNLSFQLPAGGAYELAVYGDLQSANWNLTVLLSL